LLIGNLSQSQEVTPSSPYPIMHWLLESARAKIKALNPLPCVRSVCAELGTDWRRDHNQPDRNHNLELDACRLECVL
jgi:hypothetical protein